MRDGLVTVAVGRCLSLLCLAKSDSMIKTFELKTLTKETRTAAKCLKSTLDVLR